MDADHKRTLKSMIKLTLKELDISWAALGSLMSNRLPGGAFRRNLTRIWEQAIAEQESYRKEMTAILEEFCVGRPDPHVSGQILYTPPKKGERKAEFEKRVADLQSVEVSIQGNRITEDELDAFGIVLAPMDQILLERWLILKTEIIEAEFPSEIDEQAQTPVASDVSV